MKSYRRKKKAFLAFARGVSVVRGNMTVVRAKDFGRSRPPRDCPPPYRLAATSLRFVFLLRRTSAKEKEGSSTSCNIHAAIARGRSETVNPFSTMYSMYTYTYSVYAGNAYIGVQRVLSTNETGGFLRTMYVKRFDLRAQRVKRGGGVVPWRDSQSTK